MTFALVEFEAHTLPTRRGDNVGGGGPILTLMVAGKPHIVLTLDTKEPIELGAFVGAFTSLGNEYDRFIKQAEPDLAGEADLFVHKVRSGSIIVDLIPWLSLVAPFIDDMEKALIIEKFVHVWKERFESLLSGKGEPPETR
ncbi:MAG: hypothetical protein WCD87_18100, partial [Pseudolabrys sp.]